MKSLDPLPGKMLLQINLPFLEGNRHVKCLSILSSFPNCHIWIFKLGNPILEVAFSLLPPPLNLLFSLETSNPTTPPWAVPGCRPAWRPFSNQTGQQSKPVDPHVPTHASFSSCRTNLPISDCRVSFTLICCFYSFFFYLSKMAKLFLSLSLKLETRTSSWLSLFLTSHSQSDTVPSFLPPSLLLTSLLTWINWLQPDPSNLSSVPLPGTEIKISLPASNPLMASHGFQMKPQNPSPKMQGSCDPVPLAMKLGPL